VLAFEQKKRGIKEYKKYCCVPFGTQRVETEGVSKSEDIEINPKSDSHPGTNLA
jgi:hypothetical protein